MNLYLLLFNGIQANLDISTYSIDAEKPVPCKSCAGIDDGGFFRIGYEIPILCSTYHHLVMYRKTTYTVK